MLGLRLVGWGWRGQRSLLYQVVVGVPVRHDSGDVREQVHPGVLGLFVPHVDPLEVGPHRVQENVLIRQIVQSRGP